MRARRFCLGVIWPFAAILAAAAVARAQIPSVDEFLSRMAPSDETSPDVSPETTEKPSAESATPTQQAAQLQAKRDAIAERLSVAQRALETADKPAGGANLSGEVERLKRLKILYAQQQAAAGNRAELEARKRHALEQAAGDAGLGPPPYSFFLLDELRDELATLNDRAESAAAATGASTDALETARRAADEAHRKRRAAGSAPKEILDLDVQIADEQLALAKNELAAARLNKEVVELSIALAQEKLARVAPNVTLSEAERQEKLLELDKEEADLQYALTTAEERLEYLTKRLAEVETADRPRDQQRSAEHEARHAARAAQQQYVNMLNKQCQRVADRREAWTRRFAIHGKAASPEQLSHWAAGARVAVDALARENRLQVREMDDVRKQLADVELRLQGLSPDDADRDALVERRRVARELLKHGGENLTSIELARRVHRRLVADIQEDRLTVGQRLAAVWRAVKSVWNYEIVVSDGQPVTVSMVFWGVVLLVLGLSVSRRASAAFGQKFLPRLGIHESGAAALQTLSFYTLVTLTALLALRWVNVPLTLFTFLGGAVAIGVGFGSQNLVNNFISGLILLAERPIRAGDVIEIDGLVGSVETIGARSTRICTANNYEIIVPNSSLLERNVVNWTLSDKRLRCSIKVGVAYGSPTREVARWLKKAADEHGQVLERPEPFVWFVNFGDNSLEFELYYWIQIRVMSERRRIESDLRFIIDQYFREAGLVIAYPQRDLHLDIQKPLQVALLPPQPLAAAEDTAKAA